MLNIKYKNIDNTLIAYSIFGKGKIELIIEMGLGTCMGEWWQIAEKLSQKYTILLYERLGNGSSQKSKNERTPYNIANELHNLLQQLPHKNKLVILAHSQGALYAQQFCRLYPQMIKKLILLDPLSANDNRFKTELSKKVYKRSGINKTTGLYINLILSKLHLGTLIKKIMQKAPPFYYFKNFSTDSTNYILKCLTQPKTYITAIEEYTLSHKENIISDLKNKTTFPQIPIYLITHSSEIAIKEIIKFGGLKYEDAKNIENIWQNLMQEYLQFNNNTNFQQSQNSSHYIHLTDFDLIYNII